MTQTEFIELARQRGWRTRNLHDGYPCPPTRRRGKRRSSGYRGAYASPAIVCRHGLIEPADDGLAWTLLTGTVRRFTARMQRLQAIPVTVRAAGDTEAWGYCRLADLDTVASVLQPFQRRARIQKPRSGAGFCAPESTIGVQVGSFPAPAGRF